MLQIALTQWLTIVTERDNTHSNNTKLARKKNPDKIVSFHEANKTAAAAACNKFSHETSIIAQYTDTVTATMHSNKRDQILVTN